MEDPALPLTSHYGRTRRRTANRLGAMAVERTLQAWTPSGHRGRAFHRASQFRLLFNALRLLSLLQSTATCTTMRFPLLKKDLHRPILPTHPVADILHLSGKTLLFTGRRDTMRETSGMDSTQVADLAAEIVGSFTIRACTTSGFFPCCRVFPTAHRAHAHTPPFIPPLYTYARTRTTPPPREKGHATRRALRAHAHLRLPPPCLPPFCWRAHTPPRYCRTFAHATTLRHRTTT